MISRWQGKMDQACRGWFRVGEERDVELSTKPGSWRAYSLGGEPSLGYTKSLPNPLISKGQTD